MGTSLTSTSIQGLASGIKWQDIVDQLAAVDSQRELDPITAAINLNQTKRNSWNQYQSVAKALNDAVAGFRNGTALNSLQVAGGTSSTSGRSLFSATATSDAVPGSYQVEVLGLAQADKISGTAVSSMSTAMGITGDVVINGRKVSIASGDSLSTIRDSFNTVNTGTNASGVTASILSTASGARRLVLTSDAPGARGIGLIDSAPAGGALQQLGLTDGTYSIVSDASGTTTSGGFANSDSTVATSLGIAVVPPTTIRVGNRDITIDLATDSLNAIATRIQAAGVGANVVSSTNTNGDTSYRLVIDANVSAKPSIGDPAVPDTDSLRALQLLNFAQGGRSAVAQSISTVALTAADTSPATTSTALSDLQSNGAPANFQAGDTIALAGRRGDGTAVTLSYVVPSGATMNDLLTQLNGAFGSGTRPATSSIGADGSIKLTDGTGGDSQLSLSLSVGKSVANGGGSTGLGSFHTETTGRLRTITAGSDASLRVDGVLLSRSSNVIADVIGGVTVRLTQAEIGGLSTLDVTRDTTAAVASANAMAKAYNDLVTFVTTATGAGGDLANNGSLRSSAHLVTQALLTDITGSSITRPTLAGISLDKTGKLTVDSEALTASLRADPGAVSTLFALTGSATGASLEYVAASNATTAGTYAVNVTAVATPPTASSTAPTLPFNDGGTPRAITFTDGFSGRSGSIALATGDDANAIASKLNAMFASKGLLLSATAPSGVLTIKSSQFGAAATFGVAYGSGDTTSAGQLGIAAGTFAGSDMQGLINGVAAVGLGQTLTAASGDASDGLVIRYSGAAVGAVGTANVIVGTGELIGRVLSNVTRDGDGLIASINSQLDISTAALQARGSDVSGRLERNKNALLAQFQAMETAVARIQAQGARITSMITSLQAQSA